MEVIFLSSNQAYNVLQAGDRGGWSGSTGSNVYGADADKTQYGGNNNTNFNNLSTCVGMGVQQGGYGGQSYGGGSYNPNMSYQGYNTAPTGGNFTGGASGGYNYGGQMSTDPGMIQPSYMPNQPSYMGTQTGGAIPGPSNISTYGAPTQAPQTNYGAQGGDVSYTQPGGYTGTNVPSTTRPVGGIQNPPYNPSTYTPDPSAVSAPIKGNLV